MSDRKVVKFGGTSVANYSAMLTCCGIVADDPERCIVVLSAPAGVTNALVALANEAPTKRNQHIETIQSIVIAILKECEDANIEPIRPLTNEINQLLAELTQHALAATPSFSDAQIDTLLSFGERFSTAFCTAI
ncbi:MAG: lysine-sensitive aspartokinase 3, partial [Glaciecola sp.]